MPEQLTYLTVIMNSVRTNDKNTTNWRGHCKKLVGIMGEILKMKMTNTKLNLQKEHKVNRSKIMPNFGDMYDIREEITFKDYKFFTCFFNDNYFMCLLIFGLQERPGVQEVTYEK